MRWIDWSALQRLRQTFLDGTAGQRDYWHSESDLLSYDATFGERIRWKWDYVLAELERLDWRPPEGTVLDWGCGTGVASRAFVAHWPAQRVFLTDRSMLAMQFAARRLREQQPDIELWLESRPPARVDVLLVSHVLTEVEPAQVLTTEATAILWVEPGTSDCSRRLIAVREQLRSRYHIIAPCPHQDACGLLAAGNERHWCHFFAPSPAAVYTDGFWARYARQLSIDLRQLPLSYLVLDRRGGPQLADGFVRVLGAPRVYKAHASLLGCTPAAVKEYRMMKRQLPAEFRRLRKGDCPSAQIWRCVNEQIVEMKIP